MLTGSGLQRGFTWLLSLRFIGWLVVLNGTYIVEKKLSGRFIDGPYTHLVTLVSSWVGQVILTIPVEMRSPITLGSDHSAVVIRAGCNGLEVVFLLPAGILAYPSTWAGRLRGMALYLPALYAANILRILLLLYVGATYPQLIDFFHFQPSQGILVVLVAAFWIRYVRSAPLAA